MRCSTLHAQFLVFIKCFGDSRTGFRIIAVNRKSSWNAAGSPVQFGNGETLRFDAGLVSGFSLGR